MPKTSTKETNNCPLTEILDIPEKTEPITDIIPTKDESVNFPVIPSKPDDAEQPIPKMKHEDDIEDDYRFSREKLRDIVIQGEHVFNSITELSKDSDSPRAYEVSGQIMKNIVEAIGQLNALHKNSQDMDIAHRNSYAKRNTGGELVSPNSNGGATNNYMFVGTTNDLKNLIKQHQTEETNNIQDIELEVIDNGKE